MSARMMTASSWRRSSRRAARTIRPLSRVCSNRSTPRSDVSQPMGRSVYELLGEVGTADIKILIPPRRGAVPLDGAEGTWAQRNATLETIRKVGRQGWQRKSRCRESFLQVRTLGTSLRACGYESQKRAAMIGCNVLNRVAELGKPESQAIVGE